MAYLLLNIFLCLDITFMIKGPFGSKEKRVKFYYTFTIITSILHGALVYIDIHSRKIRNTSATVMLVVTLIYIGVSVYSGVFCLFRLLKSGLSKSTRQLIIQRHWFWICVFILSNAFFLYCNAYIALGYKNL